MGAVNAAMNGLFGAIWSPFAGLNPWIGLAVMSLIFGVLVLIAMKYLSNQDRIAELKDRYKAHVLAIKLFRDDLRVVLTSLGKTLFLISLYLGHQLRPMIVMMPVFVLVFAQLQMRLAYAPHELGEEFQITVGLNDGEPGVDTDVELQLPAGVEEAGRRVRVPSLQQVVYRLRATEAGAHELAFRCDGEEVTKVIHTGSPEERELTMVSTIRSSDFWDLLLYPTDPPFEAESKFSSITSSAYPTLALPLLGIDWSFGMEIGMAITFMLLSIVAALCLKGFFGVTI